LKQVKPLLKSNPSLDGLVRAAELARAAGDWKSAIRYGRKAEQLYPEEHGMHFALGKLFFYRFNATLDHRDSEECLRNLNQAHALRPDDYKTLIFLALVWRAWVFTRRARRGRAHLAEISGRCESPGAQGLHYQGFHYRRAGSSSHRAQGRLGAPPGAPVPQAAEAEHLLERLSVLDDAVGFFAFDASGNVVKSKSTKNDFFAFDEGSEAVKSLATACRFEADRLGMGR